MRSGDESEKQRDSAQRVRVHISQLTRAEFQDLTRRLAPSRPGKTFDMEG